MEPSPFIIPETIHPIRAENDPSRLAAEINTLCTKALDWGAAGTAVIGPEDLVFGDKHRNMTQTAPDLPSICWPLDFPIDDLKEALFAYDKGIFLYIDVDVDLPDDGDTPEADKNHLAAYRKIHEIVSAVESAAFYMGHYLAMGFAAGNCRSVFCMEEGQCSAVVVAKGCTAPYKSRPSMSAVGVDPLKTAWKAHLPQPDPDRPFLSGLVMVA
ncbi:MAG: DUF2284 domain-containing protein [Desulfosalsimonadaceae bacterium]